jgi:hypothetical protein
MIIDDVWQDHPLPMIHSWAELDEYMKDMTFRYYYLHFFQLALSIIYVV